MNTYVSEYMFGRSHSFQTPPEKWTGAIERRNQESRAEVPAAAFNEGMKCSLCIAHVNALLSDRSAVAAHASFVVCPLPVDAVVAAAAIASHSRFYCAAQLHNTCVHCTPHSLAALEKPGQ